ncbi:MAG: endonuclease/exonuclease/phosphatase family protein [Burkholderiales bacterium]|nr:endonuclease/exonuclease/phosphatase family protein [Bacteroidia bacterium]
MNKILLTPLFLFGMMAGFAQTKNPLTVAFYNCENFFDTKDDPNKKDDEFLPESSMKWDEIRFMNKLQKVAQVLDSTVAGEGLPALVGLVEIENKEVLEELVSKSQFKTKSYGVLATDSPDERSIDCGLLYDKSVFTLVDFKELNATNPSLGDYKTRNVLFATLKASNGDVFYVFVNHWPSRRSGETESEPRRIFAAEQVRNKINELQKKDAKAKVIVMGDFNDHPTDKSILNTLRASDKPKDNGDLYNAYQTLDAAKQGTHYYDKEWRVLDQIIVSQGFIGAKKGYKFDPKNAHILKKDFVLFKNDKTGEEKPNRTYSGEKYYNGYSDHLSVYITLD